MNAESVENSNGSEKKDKVVDLMKVWLNCGQSRISQIKIHLCQWKSAISHITIHVHVFANFLESAALQMQTICTLSITASILCDSGLG